MTIWLCPETLRKLIKNLKTEQKISDKNLDLILEREPELHKQIIPFIEKYEKHREYLGDKKSKKFFYSKQRAYTEMLNHADQTFFENQVLPLVQEKEDTPRWRDIYKFIDKLAMLLGKTIINQQDNIKIEKNKLPELEAELETYASPAPSFNERNKYLETHGIHPPNNNRRTNNKKPKSEINKKNEKII